MSSEQIFSTSDLRSTAQDYKRDAARKHKWALGTTPGVGRAEAKPRPHRPSETEFNARRRDTKAAVASLAHGTKLARKHDMLEGTALSSGDDLDDDDGRLSSASSTTSPPAAAVAEAVPSAVMYSFDAARGPTQGSQILNVALARAVAVFEEKETVRLVRREYDMIDAAGESVDVRAVVVGEGVPASSRKDARRAKAMAQKAAKAAVDADEEEYEFV